MFTPHECLKVWELTSKNFYPRYVFCHSYRPWFDCPNIASRGVQWQQWPPCLMTAGSLPVCLRSNFIPLLQPHHWSDGPTAVAIAILFLHQPRLSVNTHDSPKADLIQPYYFSETYIATRARFLLHSIGVPYIIFWHRVRGVNVCYNRSKSKEKKLNTQVNFIENHNSKWNAVVLEFPFPKILLYIFCMT
jgi:hypothetical protein